MDNTRLQNSPSQQSINSPIVTTSKRRVVASTLKQIEREKPVFDVEISPNMNLNMSGLALAQSTDSGEGSQKGDYNIQSAIKIEELEDQQIRDILHHSPNDATAALPQRNFSAAS
jgi:hypothetical protein